MLIKICVKQQFQIKKCKAKALLSTITVIQEKFLSAARRKHGFEIKLIESAPVS